MSLDQTHYDVAIFSTGLTQSIVSAALASAGLSVIHIDKNDYYADQWASLTLSELVRWANNTAQASASASASAPKTRRMNDIQLCFPSHDLSAPDTSGQPSQLPESLVSLDRHYAISLAPTLLPATGPSIDCLINSKVSSYATFRLLECTCVASASNDGKVGLTSVPASKEDIFKTKTLSLIAKRKLMKLLMYIGTEDWQSELVQDPVKARRPFVEYLADVHKMSADLIDAVAYGVCLCASPNDTTQAAMMRAKSHMMSVGRYGNSAYLVGQYGGAGELAQGYCRASAVKGGTFILDHPIRSAKRDQSDTMWEIQVDRLDDKITADYIVSSDELLEELCIGNMDMETSADKPLVLLHKAVLVLENPIQIDSPPPQEPSTDDAIKEDTSAQAENSTTSLPPETGLIVFPPGSVSGNANTVTVLMMGEGTFSCPKGQYVYYIQTESSDSDLSRSTLEVLQPFLDEVISLASTRHTGEATEPAIKPLLQLTYRHLVSSTFIQAAKSNLSSIPFPPTASDSGDDLPVTSICGLTDAAVHLAERVYYDILATRAPCSSENSHEDKLEWVKQTIEQQKRDRKRRKGRDQSEYQGRGGRGADDGVTKESEAISDVLKEDEQEVVGFFAADADANDADDETDGQ